MPTDADDDPTAAPAIVMVASGNRSAALVLPPTAELGRRIAAGGTTCEIVDERMSRDHASVTWSRGTWVIRDLDSRNGTWIDGERRGGETRARGDVIVRLGHTVFVLLADGRGQPAADADPLVVGPELARAHAAVRRHAGADVLLVAGETGSGKETAARLWHAAGPRNAGPFVAVNCAAIPDGVAERLVFGGKKGVIETIGQLQLARGGTLFLDDIDELASSAQAALARLLDGAPLALGICAAGHLLRGAVSDGRLRADLYGRLARVAVQLPPLRARRVDLARLVHREVAPLGAHARLVESCLLRPWPGNVRELRAALRQAAVHAGDAERDVVRLEDLPDGAGMPPGTASGETAVERKQGPLVKATIVAAMERANGVVGIAARALGVHRSQLCRLLDEHGIAHDE